MADITLLDGGMGQELVHRSGDRPTALWSTQVMIDRPGLVQQIHEDFYDAGATIATANTYAMHRDRLTAPGLESAFEDLHAAALAEAKAAAKGRCIAGAIGPLTATYRPEAHPDFADAVPLYAERVALLAPHVDLILFESVASHLNALSVAEAARDADIPVWIAFTVDDEDGSRMRSGEPLSETVPHLDGADALLANCSAPEAMPAALAALAPAGLPYGAYANGFTKITKDFMSGKTNVDGLDMREDFTPANYARHVLDWVDQGATIVGGCCEVGPAHIAEISRRLRAAGHTIV